MCVRKFSLVLVALFSLAEMPAARAAEEPKDPDEQFLQESKVATDGPGLLNYLKARSGRDDDLLQLDRLIRQLGADDFQLRQEASQKLIKLGPPAHALLLQAQKGKDKERARRAKECAEEINRAWNFGLNLTVVRRLVKLHPEGTAQALLQFLPYAADEECEEEIWFGLDSLAKAEPRLVATLSESLKDKLHMRRAAGGYLFTRRGNVDQRAAGKKLLADPDPIVRLRTAQGLLASKDKDAIPVLIDSLEKLRWTEEAWQAEEMLHWVAGDDAPEPTIGAGSTEARQKCRRAWQEWWQANAGKIDFAKLEKDYRRPGLILLLTSNNDRKNPVHCLSVIGCDGRPRWELKLLIRHVQLLPRDRILVAESETRQTLIRGQTLKDEVPSGLSERDLTGKVLWRAPGKYTPHVAYRLPNGNTVFPAQFSLAEITPEGQEVAAPLKAALHDGLMFLAYPRWLPDGNILGSTNPSSIIEALAEFDARTGRLIRKINLPDKIEQGNIQPLPNGHYLIASGYSARVLETDAAGKTVWSANLRVWGKPAPMRNGNFLAVGPSGLMELDKQGKSKWHVFLQDHSSRFDTCLGLARLGFDWPRPQDLDLARSIPYWVKGLQAKNTEIRITSGLTLRELGSKATAALPALIAALDDPEVQVWRLAQDTLGNIGAPAVPSLVNAVKSPKATIRSRAAWILGGLPGDKKMITAALLEAMKDPDVEVRRGAATALGCLKEEAKSVVPALIRAIRNEQEDDEVRLMACHSLGRLGHEAKPAIPYLLQCLKGKSSRVAHWAALALGDIGPVDESLVPGLIEALKNDELIFGVCMALGKIGQEAEAAVPALIEIVKTSNYKTPTGINARACAISALGGIGRPAAPALPMLLDILKNPDAEVDLRISAAYALGGIKPVSNETLSALRETAKANDQLGQTAAQSLRKIGAAK